MTRPVAESPPSSVLHDIARLLQRGRGLRLGEAAVVSTRVHMVDAGVPATVFLLDADAGQAFYGRALPGEVIHIDVFHTPGRVDHRLVAEAVCRAARGCVPALDPDFIDLQTGTGGGRVTGYLDGGRKPALLESHRDHVHLALRWEAQGAGAAAALVALVDAVERSVLSQGLDLRRVDHLRRRAGGGMPAGISAYRDTTDSRLVQSGSQRHGATATGGNGGAPGQVAGAPNLLLQWREPAGGGASPLYRRSAADGLAAAKPFGARDGQSGRGPWRHPIPAADAVRSRTAALAVAETAAAWMLRRAQEGRRAREGRWLPLSRRDLRVQARAPRLRRDVCLLIDCSASMAGPRLEAARALARRLLRATGDRVAVAAFQDGGVRFAVPLTRNSALLEQGLQALRAGGLTPMAQALAMGRQYLRAETSLRHPLLVLITDGIPTVPCWTANPLVDAVRAATELRRDRLPLVCIGVQPAQPYLRWIADAAGASLYLLQDLHAEALVRIVRRERRRTAYQAKRESQWAEERPFDDDCRPDPRGRPAGPGRGGLPDP